MENLILICCLLCAMVCVTVAGMAAAMVWKVGFSPAAKASEQARAELTEIEKASAEAQRRFEQGFVNMMSYDGSPIRREERDQF